MGLADLIEDVALTVHKVADTVRQLPSVDAGSVQVPLPIPMPPVQTTPLPTPTPTPAPLNMTGPMWLGEWSGDVWSFVHNAVANAAGKTCLFICYNIPGRDNGNYSAGGPLANHTPQEFYDWYGKIADAIGNASALIVLEPDALGLLAGLATEELKQERYTMLQGAIDGLRKKPNVKILVDASLWVSAEDMGARIGKLHNLDGFSCNVSGYAKTEEVMPWAEAVCKITNLHYIIDTSRNGLGNPHAPMWCNVTDTKVGVLPTNVTASRNCEFYLWCKIPGESDGLGINDDGSHPRNDVPGAGGYWPEYHDAIYTGDWTAFKKKYAI